MQHRLECFPDAADLLALRLGAFLLALAREPKEDELAALEDYAKREGLENACRVILNLNEFSFID